MNYSCDGDSSCASAAQHVGLSCDDGNPLTVGDTCQSDGSCAGIASYCGDGSIGSGEECDDGDYPGASGDGCDASCQLELYWVCDGAPSVCHRLRILYAPADVDNATLRSGISGITGGVVDFWDAYVSLPALANMQAYDCVYTFPNDAYYDSTTMGNTLASYVDWGGTVVLGSWCTYTSGNSLSGAIMGSGYSPVYSPSGTNHGAGSSYIGDGFTTIHYAVSSYAATYRDYLAVWGSGTADGHYADGEIAHAYRSDYKVVYSNGFPNTAYGATGDWPRLIANSCAAAYYLGY
jgi:cysteine-rich repeat protein